MSTFKVMSAITPSTSDTIGDAGRGAAICDDYRLALSDEKDGQVIAGILAALSETLRKLEGLQNAWARRNLRRAVVLMGGLEETVAHEILGQEGL